MADRDSPELVDVYRETFKYFKSYTTKKENRKNNGISSLCVLLTLPKRNEDKDNVNCSDSDEDVVLREICFTEEIQCKCFETWGLRSPMTWKVVQLTFPKGLIVIQNPFTSVGQRYWISRTLLDFPHNPEYITNMDNLNRLQMKSKGKFVDTLADFKLDTCSKDFYSKLRWVTFGYHHDWDTKVYSDSSKSNFPEDLADMTRYISQILGFTEFEAEAAIANYYHMDSTLSGHVDRSEVNQSAPLFSLSFGQSAIFLIGGKTKYEKAQPVVLRSGDIAIMSGDSRLSYHGVPKIISAVEQPWSLLCDNSNDSSGPCKRQKLSTTNENLHAFPHTHNCELFTNSIKDHNVFQRISNTDTEWTPFLNNYISKSRINLNIRQVLFPGQSNLSSNFNFAI